MSALIYGADLIIEESERIAFHFNIPHFIIGATLIAFGTSLPEMAASVNASLNDKSEMAISNVLGSVIFNITLVLGFVFLIARKIEPKRDLFAKDSAWSLFPILVFLLMIFDGVIDRFEGIIFLVMMGGYLLFLFKDGKEMLEEELDDELEKEAFAWGKTLILLFVGFAFVIIGAKYVIESGSTIALNFGVSEWLIGLLLISLGTSLPELVVSISAARKNSAEMAIGNIIGSNVANFTMVLGAAALINPLTLNVSSSLFDIIVALIVSIMLLFITANRLYNRSAGLVLILTLLLFLNNNLTIFN
jgi:cation:H+ antiporter